PDAGRLALLRGLRLRRQGIAVDRRDGGRLYGDHAVLADHRAAIRQSDADRGAGEAAARESLTRVQKRNVALIRRNFSEFLTRRSRLIHSCLLSSSLNRTGHPSKDRETENGILDAIDALSRRTSRI